MGGATRLIPLDLPVPARVRTDRDGNPVEILTGRAKGTGARMRRGRRPAASTPLRVAGIRDSWRIDDEWWRTPLSRLYHEVVLENGKVLILYRDLLEGGWWSQ